MATSGDGGGRSQADEIIAKLRLEPHSEGGFFRRMYVGAPLPTATARAPGPEGEPQQLCNSIYYMLTADSPIGHWHKNVSDITEFFHLGAPLRYHLLSPSGVLTTEVLGGDVARGEKPQFTVRGGWWKAAETLGDFTLISEVTTPSFRYVDRVLARPDDFNSVPAVHALGDRFFAAAAPRYLWHMTPAAWFRDEERQRAHYLPQSEEYERDGFVHLCNDADQMLEVANVFLKDILCEKWVVLVLNQDKLEKLVFEAAASVPGIPLPASLRDKTFPHVYAAIPRHAIVGDFDVLRGPDGEFSAFAIPDELFAST